MRTRFVAMLMTAAIVLAAGCGQSASESRWWNGNGNPGSNGDYGGSYYSSLLGSWMGAPVQDLFRSWGPPDWDTIENGVREVGYEDPEGDWGFMVDRRGIIYDGYFDEY